VKPSRFDVQGFIKIGGSQLADLQPESAN